VFVAVEGPNGVGKSTIAALLATQWQARNSRLVHLTSEPSATPIGTWLRQAEAWIDGRAFALVLAADRYLHVDQEIIPTLDAGTHVVTDRYVQSSLVLQRIDAMDLDEDLVLQPLRTAADPEHLPRRSSRGDCRTLGEPRPAVAAGGRQHSRSRDRALC
jgi:dTMP kinase